MVFTAWQDGRFKFAGTTTRCALGKSGLIDAADKREGDGKSPIGAWPIRRLVYRPDKGSAPYTALPSTPIAPDDGWCDDPADPAYNQPVKRPYPASSEAMWRNDDAYDLVVILAHNDDPPVPGMGSAIFLHLAKPGYPPTEGCVALSRQAMEAVLAMAQVGDTVEIRA